MDKNAKIWPVHFNTSEAQRRKLDDYAAERKISMAEAARTLIDTGLRRDGVEV